MKSQPVLGVSELCISYMRYYLKKYTKNVFKNLTEIPMFPDRGDVTE